MCLENGWNLRFVLDMFELGLWQVICDEIFWIALGYVQYKFGLSLRFIYFS